MADRAQYQDYLCPARLYGKILYKKYQFAATLACASLPVPLALVILALETLVEGRILR